ncbi:MAG: efflux RND transporter permease subunit [Planctomycetaceae bacterium]
MRRTFDALMIWSADHRSATAALVLALTAIAIVGYWNPELVRSWLVTPELETTVDDGSGAANEVFETPPDVDPVSLSNSDAVLVVQSDAFFTPAGAKAMRHVVDRLEELNYVRRILWMDRVPVLNIFGLPEPLFPRSQASEQRFAAAQEKAMQHPLVGGQLLSEDGRTTLLLISFDWDFVRTNEQVTVELREAAERAAADFPDVPLSFQITGHVPAVVTMLEAHESNRVKYQAIGYGTVLLMAIFLFRGVRAVLIVTLAPVTGLIWTIGILQYFDLDENPFIDIILPVLLVLVGMTDGVHLIVQIRKLQASGLKERPAVRQALKQVGMACFLTSLTTGIGFGSLMLAENDWVREFGWCCVIGVALMFVAVVTVIPLASGTRLGRNIHVGQEGSLIDRNLNRIAGLIETVLRRPKLVSAIGIGSTALLIAASLTLRPDERRSNALPEHSEAYQALKHMDENLGGLEFSRVDVSWSSDVGRQSPEILQVVTEADDLLHTEPLIGYPLSIRNLVDSLPGSGPAEDRMSMIELLPPPLKRAFFTPEYRYATVNFRVQDLGIARFDSVFRRVQAGLKQIEQRHPDFHLQLSGMAISRWENVYQIVIDLALSLGTAALVIFFVLGLTYRSVRIGLISVVPNLFPLAATGAWLAVSGQSLELVSVLAFTVCLGIAVDDTIHFLTRFEEEYDRTGDRTTAIRNAFTGVGVALVMTTSVLLAGFGIVSFSDSRDHHIFASMGAMTIAAALFADLVFLPALLCCFAPSRRSVQSGSSVAAGEARDAGPQGIVAN